MKHVPAIRARMREAPFGSAAWMVSAVLLAVGLGLLVPAFTGMVVVAGRNIAQPHIISDYTWGIVWAALLTFSLVLWPVSQRDRLLLVAVWLLKAGVALGPMMFYEMSYTVLDAYWYYDHAIASRAVGAEFGLGLGLENTLSMVFLLGKLVGPSYHALKIAFSFIGLAGIYAFYRAAVIVTGREDARVFLGIALFPSILFWSSILGKDPIALFGMGVYAYGVCAWQRRASHRYLAVVAAGIIVSAGIRLWFAPLLMVPLLWLTLRAQTGAIRRLAILSAALVAFTAGMYTLRDHFSIETTRDLLQATNTISRAWAEGGSARELPEFTSLPAVAAFIPRGAFTALFRPLPGEVRHIFGLLAGVENLLLIGLLLLAVLRLRRDAIADPLIQALILLVLAWSVLYSVVSYQNLGTAVRFKLQILPVLLGLLMYLAFPRYRGASQTSSQQ